MFAAERANYHPGAKSRVERTLALCTALAGLLLFLGCLNAGVFLFGKAIAQMEQVTQTNAASAEESASAAEELSAQSDALKDIVGRLTAMVGGGGERHLARM